jgi:hypothetical protein
LWNHQGANSKIGEAMRFMLGMGAGEPMHDHHVAMAKRWNPEARILQLREGPYSEPNPPAQPEPAKIADGLNSRERHELKLRREQEKRVPFCPDHRDKVRGLTCRQCEIERLTAQLDRLSQRSVPEGYEYPLNENVLPQTDANAQLMSFYNAGCVQELIDAQERHIQRLQEKLLPLRDDYPHSPRA